jgi:hypothetical protein
MAGWFGMSPNVVLPIMGRSRPGTGWVAKFGDAIRALVRAALSGETP